MTIAIHNQVVAMAAEDRLALVGTTLCILARCNALIGNISTMKAEVHIFLEIGHILIEEYADTSPQYYLLAIDRIRKTILPTGKDEIMISLLADLDFLSEAMTVLDLPYQTLRINKIIADLRNQIPLNILEIIDELNNRNKD